MTDEHRALYERAIQTWGGHAQLRMLQEECSECAVAVAHACRDRKVSSTDELVDEIADVEIMVEQMRVLLGDEMIDRAREGKLARLAARLGKEGL